MHLSIPFWHIFLTINAQTHINNKQHSPFSFITKAYDKCFQISKGLTQNMVSLEKIDCLDNEQFWLLATLWTVYLCIYILTYIYTSFTYICTFDVIKLRQRMKNTPFIIVVFRNTEWKMKQKKDYAILYSSTPLQVSCCHVQLF